MKYSTGKIEREINAEGLEFDKGSFYDRLCKLTDLRGANGKRYNQRGEHGFVYAMDSLICSKIPQTLLRENPD